MQPSCGLTSGGAVLRPLTDEEMHLYMQPWLGEAGQAAFYRQIAQMSDRFTDEIEHRFAEVRCPVTILWSQHDEWIPIAKGRDLAQRISGARFRSIPNAKHLVQEDAPEAVVATALEFLPTCVN
jgi:pimeloyl-ACP methyl ester carboxylesterase